jgi:hypothetical protein
VEHYALNLNLPEIPASNLPDIPATPAGDSGIKKSRKNTTKENAGRAVVTADANVTDKPHGKGLTASVSSARPSGGIKPGGICTSKQRVNELRLTPEGRHVDDDPESVLHDLDQALGLAGGEPIKRSVLNELLGLRGAEYLNFWRAWLPYKIAAEYKAGRPVKKPTGLYTEAVRGGWEVNPTWPAFDEVLHTVAARDTAEAEASVARATAKAEANSDFDAWFAKAFG